MHSMIDTAESETIAFVGISFSNNVIYNIVERDGEFEHTGRSIIHFLKTDKNNFMSKLIESQSYDGIKALFDDEMKFGGNYDPTNHNIDSFQTVYNIMNEENVIDYYYIYDLIEDVLIVKTPDLDESIAIDYRSSEDVRNFINKLKHRE